MSRLKIALVANNIHFRGGMERYFAELATALCGDHEVHLFASEIDDVPRDKVTIHTVRTVKRPQLLLLLQYYWKSSNKLRSKDYDVVHTIGGITAKQNFVTAQYCQYAWGDTIHNVPGARNGITLYHEFMWRFGGFLEKRALTSNSTLRICANSKRTRSDLVRFYGCDPDKIDVIYNAVDAVRFNPANQRYRSQIRQRYGIPEAAVVVLFVGEYRRKGLITLIRALESLKEYNVHLLAVGRGDRKKYEALAARHGITEQSTFAGPSRDVERIFGAADIFAFPTYYEPFGMVITEAMASGLPVVTTRNAGAAEMIEDGRSGFLIDRPHDAGELAQKLQVLVSDPDLRTRVGLEARTAAGDYSWSQLAQDTLEMYHKGLLDRT